MKSAGVICECNPFHGGHELLLRRAVNAGAEVTVCLMSGSFTQRGDAAIADARLRAGTLLSGGADAVLELPFPFSSSPAEFFASAGVDILSRLGVEELWFGSESGDTERLSRAARIAESEDFRTAYAQRNAGSTGTASAYFEALKACGMEGDALSPNDILAVSYLRAILRTGSSLLPRTVRREGNGYGELSVEAGKLPSAAALRRLWETDGADAVLPLLPDGSEALYRDAVAKGCAPANLANAERMILGRLRAMTQTEAESCAELSGGLGNRLAQAARESSSLTELLSRTATKKYPDARVRRGILFALCGVTPEDLRARSAYVRLLGANGRGMEFLASCRRKGTLPVVTRQKEIPDTAGALRQKELETRALELYSLCLPKIGSAADFLRRAPLIIREESI